MNGAGTKESPYIIMNADDLYSMETVGGSEVYFAMGSNIDLNNSQYAENFKPIPLNCKKLTGNNYVIRNINYSNPVENASIFSVAGTEENNDISIDGLIIDNIRLSGKNVFIFRNDTGNKCTVSLEHCVFTLNDIVFCVSEPCTQGSQRCMMHDNNIAVTADYCTFVARVSLHKMQPLFSGDTISHSQLKLEISTVTLPLLSDSYNIPMVSVTVSDSYFFTTIDRKVNAGAEAMNFSSYDSIFSSCYMVCEVIAGISSLWWNGIMGNVCFFDKEVLARNIKSVSMKNDKSGYSSKLLGLTTEQCKDPVYLRSVGFSCAGAE